MISILHLQLMILACLNMLWTVEGWRDSDPCKSHNDFTGEDHRRIWPAGIVHYRMSNRLSKNVSLAVEKEIQRWELHSCIKFVPHVNYPDFIVFVPGVKSCAFFGKVYSGQHRVSLSRSVSTNDTALNIIFAKLIGIRNSTLLFADSLWSNDPPIASNDRVNVKRSNSPNVTSSTESKRGPMCDRIKACAARSFEINSNNSLRQHHINSPGYPHGYANGMDCVWSIYNIDRRSVNISFNGSSLEVCDYRHYKCDCVEITTIDTEGDRKPSLWRRLCSSYHFQEDINTNASKIIIWFYSDTSVNDRGFMANITWAKLPSIDDCTLANGGCEHTCVPAIVTNSTTRTCQCDVGFELSADDEASCKDVNECEDNNGGCSHHCNNTNGSYHCSCEPEYFLDHDNVTCKGCNELKTIYETHIVIKSPYYHAVYPAHSNCVWKIQSETPKSYKLTINHFDVRPSIEDCTEDYLEITDKPNTLNLPKLCGAHLNISTITSRTAELTIRFKTTRLSLGHTGFHLVYHQLD